jgi:hypothetical protein
MHLLADSSSVVEKLPSLIDIRLAFGKERLPVDLKILPAGLHTGWPSQPLIGKKFWRLGSRDAFSGSAGIGDAESPCYLDLNRRCASPMQADVASTTKRKCSKGLVGRVEAGGEGAPPILLGKT